MKIKSINSISRNYIYNMTYELFLLIVPFAVTPYVSRVLGASASGKYSFMLSIVTYFTLVAALGFDRYAQRLVATHRGNEVQQAYDFWEVILCRGISTIFSIAVYIVVIFSGILGDGNGVIATILLLNIIAIGIDSTFYFQGNEDFKLIAIRNIVIKAIGFACIFLFVKKPDDIWIYTLIQSLIIFFSNISLWICLPKSVIYIKWEKIKPLCHLKPAIILFLPSIAISIYTSLDKTLIGVFTGNAAENGFYEYSEKIVKMALMVITALGAVMIPRNSQKVAKEGPESIQNNIYMAIRFVFFVGMPMSLGLIAISSNFVPWYLGVGYDKAVILIRILAPIIVIIGLSNVLGVQYLLPTKQDKMYTLAISAGATVNLLLNCLLIPSLGSSGAAIGTLVAESSVTIMMMYITNRTLHLKNAIDELNIWKYMLASSIMFVSVLLCANMLVPSVLHSMLLLLLGGSIYLGILLITKEYFCTKVIYATNKYLWEMKKKRGNN